MISKEKQLEQLVDLYATMRAYDEVSKTCDLLGFARMVEQRRESYMNALRAYARRYYARKGSNPLARAMDDVINRYNQLTIWSEN